MKNDRTFARIADASLKFKYNIKAKTSNTQLYRLIIYIGLNCLTVWEMLYMKNLHAKDFLKQHMLFLKKLLLRVKFWNRNIWLFFQVLFSSLNMRCEFWELISQKSLVQYISNGIPASEIMMCKLNSHQEKGFRWFEMGTLARNRLRKHLCHTKILKTTWIKMIAEDLIFLGYTSIHKNNKGSVTKAHYLVCHRYFSFLSLSFLSSIIQIIDTSTNSRKNNDFLN